MRILLTGSNGTLGRMLQESLSRHEVLPMRQTDLNLTDLNAIGPFVDQKKPDLVINAAAYNDVDAAESQADLANRLNGEAVGALANAARLLHVPFVHYSTDYVFDGQNTLGYTEDAPASPISAYGRSKALGEDLVRSSGAEYLIIRTSRLYGEWTDDGVSKPSFVRRILERAAEQTSLEIVNDEISSPTYARDLAQASADMITQGLRGTFHRSNDGACTWFQFARAILDSIQWNGTLIPVAGSRFPRSAQRPASSILLSTKIPPMRSWQAALKDHLARVT